MASKRLLARLLSVIVLLAILCMLVQVMMMYLKSDRYNNLLKSENPWKINEKYAQGDKIIRSLEHQIQDLESALETKKTQLNKMNSMKGSINLQTVENAPLYADGDRVIHFLQDQISKSRILKASHWKNEYFVSEYLMFDRNFVYKLELGMKQRPQDIISSRHDWNSDFSEVIKVGVESLNSGSQRLDVSPTYRFTEKDFQYGICRSETSIGTEYELIFKPTSSSNLPPKLQLFQTTLFRPYGPLLPITSTSTPADEVVHFIVPLKDRIATFRIFMDFFKQTIAVDGNVHLTVVYFGEGDGESVDQELHKLANDTGFHRYNLVKVVDGEFSRGKALQMGVESLKGDNPLMFLCDVDIGFTPQYLDQCRSYTRAGSSVFYPIVFSLYNPDVVFRNDVVPNLHDQQVIKNSNGFWRDFGFGMTCQFKSDFLAIGGFDLSIRGWGTEDTLLYRRFAMSDVKVVRSPVNTLFHHWHPKDCNKDWSTEQYESCLKSRARTEGSMKDIGLLYFQLKQQLGDGGT
uniref:Hexosyltransferase n=1 Tax=Ciona savignyi TaxID=51511 RepID=H2Y7A6_CIOSA